MIDICGCGFIYYENAQLIISYAGNMGTTKLDVSKLVQSEGLPSLDVFAEYPSFYEEGSPDYLYNANVNFDELSSDIRLRIASIVCKRYANSIESDSIDEKLAKFYKLKEVLSFVGKCLES